ncbi:MAG: acetylornithine transaminase [Candidatus Nanopelagicales bacterium]|jgi:acetylornithine/N-succinyldiaminopimelate aminotransferase|nr:acetylornithine transaminase [Candidatus Nanopelagicales bacterium]
MSQSSSTELPTSIDALREQWSSVMMSNYGAPSIRLVRGSGSRVWDDQGVDYIDLIAGIAVNALGHADPRITDAVTLQLSTLGHVSNLFATDPGLQLAARLIAMTGWDDSARVFFCNSGAEANEAAFKMARLTGRTHMVVAQSGFHGRTMGALALTAQPAKQDPFRPLPGEVTAVPFGDEAALRAAVTQETAAILLEPVQGEGGVIPAPAGYLSAARQIADESGALLILDEVQSGIGRTGTWFAHQHASLGPVVPDVITLAKGLGGGIPIGAVVAHGRAAALLGPGSHGSTFGGNPVSASAALAVLNAIDSDGLLERASFVHERFARELPARSSGVVRSVRGLGLLMAAELNDVPSATVDLALKQAGVLANAVSPDAIRMAPALNISDAEIDDALDRWEFACSALQNGDSA